MKYKVFRIIKDEVVIEAENEEDAVLKTEGLMNWQSHSISTTAIKFVEDINVR